MKPTKLFTPRPITDKGKLKMEWHLALTRADNRCQAFPKVQVRCHRVATEVWETGYNTFTAFCRECRVAGCGASPAEKRLGTMRFKSRQLSLLGTDK